MSEAQVPHELDVVRPMLKSQGSLTWSGEDWPVLWNALLGAVQEGVCLLDHQGCVLSLNREARRLLGWSEQDVVGRRWHDITDCMVSTEHQSCPIDMVLSDRRVTWGDQVTIKTRTGGRLLVSYTCIPTGLGEGSPALIYRFRDLGPIVHLTNEIRSTRALLDANPIPMVELSEHGTVLWGNATMLHYLERYEYRPSMVPAVLPEHLSEIVCQCLGQEMPVVDVVTEIQDLRLAWMFQRIPGLPKRVCAYGIPAGASDHVSDQARPSAAAVLDRFTAAVSYRLGMRHEALALLNYQIRTPLMDILGLVDLLGRTELTLSQRTYMDAISRACGEVVSVLKGLRTLVHVETQQGLVLRHPFVLAQIWEEAVSAVSHEGTDVDVMAVLAPDCWQVFDGDAERVAEITRAVLRQAVRNSGWGRVTVRGRVDQLDAQTSLVTLIVTDVGPSLEYILQTDVLDEIRSVQEGLDPALIDRRSIGFELPLAKRLCGLMGGALTVRYVPNEGNRYEVRLRLVRSLAEEPDRPQSHPWACKRALAVGGHPMEQEGLTMTLQRLGLPTTAVRTMAEGYTQLRKAPAEGPPYGVIFVNVARGEEIPLLHLETLGKLPMLGHTDPMVPVESVQLPIVLLLDGRTTVDRDVVFKVGVAAILRKPVRTASLEVCLQTVLGEREWFWMDKGFPMQKPPATEPIALTHGRVLVIEDNQAHQVVARALLESLGYAVDLASSAKAGIQAFAENDYCAVLCDCYMPESSGYSIAAELRRLEASERRTPIIGLSADHWNEAKGRAVGIDRFLMKPIVMNELKTVLEEVQSPSIR